MDNAGGTADVADLDDDIAMKEAPAAIETPTEGPEDLFDPPGSGALVEPPFKGHQGLIKGYSEDLDHVDGEVQQLEKSELQEDTKSSSQLQPKQRPRLYPIEVVLTPPADPGAYEILSPSFIVDRVLEEVRIGDQSWYSVEYSDGRVEQVSALDYLFAALPLVFPSALASVDSTLQLTVSCTHVYICTCRQSPPPPPNTTS